MTERLLQFIWQFQYFDRSALTTTAGQLVDVIRPGVLNRHQGPDFFDGLVRIGSTTWAGHIELHVRAVGWVQHAHESDPHYNNVILHVVWEGEGAELRFPTIVLADRVPKFLLERYHGRMYSQTFIPCAAQLLFPPVLSMQAWIDRLNFERLIRRKLMVDAFRDRMRGDWEQTLWWMVARSFGQPVNTAAFEAVAESLPVSLLVRHRNRLQQLVALLLGQAGLFGSNRRHQFPEALALEFAFYQKKYRLPQPGIRLKFLRMRPRGFPDQRLVQLAYLVHRLPGSLMSLLLDAEDPRHITKLLVEAPTGTGLENCIRQSQTIVPAIGHATAGSIVINGFIPVLFAYGAATGRPALQERAMEWLCRLSYESHRPALAFRALGFPANDAAASQAWVELKQGYCDTRRCLECAIGSFMLRPRV